MHQTCFLFMDALGPEGGDPIRGMAVSRYTDVGYNWYDVHAKGASQFIDKWRRLNSDRPRSWK